MKKLRNFVVVSAMVFGAGLAFGQSANLKGKAMSASSDCIQGLANYGTGLQTTVNVYEDGICPDGSPKYAADVLRVGHCPGGLNILCLVIAFPVSHVTFDCEENVESVECFNQE